MPSERRPASSARNATLDAPESDAEARDPHQSHGDRPVSVDGAENRRVVRIRVYPQLAAGGVRASRLARDCPRPAPPSTSSMTPRRARGDARVRSSRGGDEARRPSPRAGIEDEGPRGPGVRGRLSSGGGLADTPPPRQPSRRGAARRRGRAVALAQLAHAPASADAARHQAATAARFDVGGAGRTHADGSAARRAAMPRRRGGGSSRRVVGASVAPNPELLARAGGWLVRAMRDDANWRGRRRWCRRGARRVVGGDGIDARRRVDQTGRRHGDTRFRDGTRKRPRARRGRLRRAQTASNCVSWRFTVCRGTRERRRRRRRWRRSPERASASATAEGGRGGQGGASHAALIASRLVARHFARCPTWLKTRAKRIVRGEVLSHGASPRRTWMTLS